MVISFCSFLKRLLTVTEKGTWVYNPLTEDFLNRLSSLPGVRYTIWCPEATQHENYHGIDIGFFSCTFFHFVLKIFPSFLLFFFDFLFLVPADFCLQTIKEKPLFVWDKDPCKYRDTKCNGTKTAYQHIHWTSAQDFKSISSIFKSCPEFNETNTLLFGTCVLKKKTKEKRNGRKKEKREKREDKKLFKKTTCT